MKTIALLLPFLVLACSKTDGEPQETGNIDTQNPDTHTPADSGDTDTEEPCLAEVIEITPEDGEDDVFYRDSLSAAFTEDASAAVFTLTDNATAAAVAHTVSWGEGNLMATLEVTGFLAGASAYTLNVSICEVESSASFETSGYGQPIDGGNEALTGMTSVILFENVNFTQPENIGAIIAGYLDVPLLVGVLGADANNIDVIAAQGYFHNVDGYKQRINQDTWTFGQVDLDGNAFFSGQVSEIDFGDANVSIPVHDFALSGTFAPDGTHFAGGTIGGQVDTRFMAPLFGQTDPEYACTLLGSMGAICEPCPDGEVFCLTLLGEEIVSTPVPDVSLVEVGE